MTVLTGIRLVHLLLAYSAGATLWGCTGRCEQLVDRSYREMNLGSAPDLPEVIEPDRQPEALNIVGQDNQSWLAYNCLTEQTNALKFESQSELTEDIVLVNWRAIFRNFKNNELSVELTDANNNLAVKFTFVGNAAGTVSVRGVELRDVGDPPAPATIPANDERVFWFKYERTTNEFELWMVDPAPERGAGSVWKGQGSSAPESQQSGIRVSFRHRAPCTGETQSQYLLNDMRISNCLPREAQDMGMQEN